MNTRDIKLPPLPESCSDDVARKFSTWQLEAYAREAVRLNAAELEDENERLREELVKDEAVRRDAERLDFLDSLNAALNRHYGTDYGWRLILSPNIVRLMSGRHQNGYVGDIDLNDSECSKHRGKSCRDAIDAAIAAQYQEPTK